MKFISGTTIIKALRDVAVVALGFLIPYWTANPPVWWDLSIGALLLMAYKYIKHDLSVKLP